VGSNRSQVFTNNMTTNPSHNSRDYWMRQAFLAGAKSTASETTKILGSWATACAGLDPELLSPDEVYDRAQENLLSYYQELGLQNEL
jgi:hypothetical protein